MKKTPLIISLVALSLGASAFGQNVNIRAKGEDIRTVIGSIFEQAKQQYVFETSVRQSLYMNLENIKLETAMDIVSRVADLSFENRNGIWFVNKRKAGAPGVKMIDPKPQTTPATEPQTAPQTFATMLPLKVKATEPTKAAPTKTAPVKAAPTKVNKAPTKGPKTVPNSSTMNMTSRLTTRLQKMDIRAVFEEFGKQTKTIIVVDDSVPNYKIDAFMFNTSLKFALDRVCKAAGLKYDISTGEKVLISKA